MSILTLSLLYAAFGACSYVAVLLMSEKSRSVPEHLAIFLIFGAVWPAGTVTMLFARLYR